MSKYENPAIRNIYKAWTADRCWWVCFLKVGFEFKSTGRFCMFADTYEELTECLYNDVVAKEDER